MTTDYNGWANRATWNVALWLGNDESLYRIVTDYVRRASRPSYDLLARTILTEFGSGTPDGVSWLDDDIDHDALDEMLVTWFD